MVVIVADPALKPSGAAARLDPADESRRGHRVERLIHGWQGNVADLIADRRGECLDAKVIATPDGAEQRDTRGRHSQAGTAQFLGRGRDLGCGHPVKPTGLTQVIQEDEWYKLRITCCYAMNTDRDTRRTGRPHGKRDASLRSRCVQEQITS